MFKDFKVGAVIASSTLKRGNKKTTILIVFILSLIFVNLIFLPSVINGMLDVFVGAVTDYTYGDVGIEPAKDKAYIDDADIILDKINELNGVEGVAKRLTSGATLSYEKESAAANILGINPDEEKKVSKFHEIVKQGEFLGEMSRDEIMLGILLAGGTEGGDVYDNLGGVKVGQKINVTYANSVTREYKIIGIHSAGPELSDLVALVHYKELEDVLGLIGKDKASNILIKIQTPGEETKIKNKILDLGITDEVFSWQEKAEKLIRDALKSMGLLNVMSEAVSLIVAAFVILIIIYINTLNKKKQIGILRAVGISPRAIIFSYMLISLFYVLMGILVGGIFLFVIVGYFNVYPIKFYEALSVTPVVGIDMVLRNTFNLILISLVAGFFPAWFVTKQKMIEAIWGRE